MEQELISPGQLRAARALLGWSQEQLALRSGFSSMTIKRAEGVGSPTPAAETIFALRMCLEAAGIHFIAENGGGEGVRLSSYSPTRLGK